MQCFPQELINVRVADKHAVSENAVVANAIAEAEAKLDGSGRILVRPSGTEPLVRVMVEAATHEEAWATPKRSPRSSNANSVNNHQINISDFEREIGRSRTW